MSGETQALVDDFGEIIYVNSRTIEDNRSTSRRTIEDNRSTMRRMIIWLRANWQMQVI